MKAIHRLIRNSAAYQQAAVADGAGDRADPENGLFMRRVPRRLSGEALRDAMLAVSGQLDATMFGAGTKDERSRRRSIYFTIKRSQLIGAMVVFDQPEPLVAQGARPTTTVAPQALLMMNGAQVRQWAEAFAKRVETESKAPGDASGKITYAYRLALGRAPTADELREARA